jgi:hypothetical protein
MDKMPEISYNPTRRLILNESQYSASTKADI